MSLFFALIRRLLGDRRANVAPIVAILAPTLILLGLGTTDAAIGLDTKNDLQSANDAASLAVAHAVLANVNATETSLQTTAQAVLNSDFKGRAATILSFHVCAPVQNDCKPGGVPLPLDTVTLTTSAQALCTLCLSGGSSKTVYGSSQTVIGFSQDHADQHRHGRLGVHDRRRHHRRRDHHLQLGFRALELGETGRSRPLHQAADNPPCAFACHDEGNSTTTADIALGLTHAHSAGATTRFDVMTSAATQLINYVAGQASSNTLLAKNTYVFNVYSSTSPCTPTAPRT